MPTGRKFSHLTQNGSNKQWVKWDGSLGYISHTAEFWPDFRQKNRRNYCNLLNAEGNHQIIKRSPHRHKSVLVNLNCHQKVKITDGPEIYSQRPNFFAGLRRGGSFKIASWARISKLSRSPEIDSKESIPPAYVAMAGPYDNRMPTRFLAPIDCLKIPVLMN